MNDINQFIDERNFNLWNLLNTKFNITIENSNNGEYSCFTKNSDATLYVNPNNICIESFSHELLHIYLKYKEFYLGSSLIYVINQSRILNRLCSGKLIDHIGNCLDHLKMFEIYKELGFQNEKFLLDYHKHKLSDIELNTLKRNYKIGIKINTNVVDLFIGKLVAILCDPNPENNYKNALFTFKQLDPKLYFAVETLIEETKAFNIDSNDILVSYRDISNNFYSNLVNWIKATKMA
jgi:hypothetical protein